VNVDVFSVNRGEMLLLEDRGTGWRPGKDIAGLVVPRAGQPLTSLRRPGNRRDLSPTGRRSYAVPLVRASQSYQLLKSTWLA
jgi:hypothetical protein